ncbi:type II secretion system protein [Alkaliphilus peptidifermentans]|uniref:Uncharacterized protein n=1 Tax=Alkaliphilus peptidifermentans DSM 18978 TaxID=1120976 RepID=A0A1G5GJ16_9FIRM|nr:hypothetical protein [Alkaliphilus peptidifermentans]SCY50698.1 hypothetical protein SAMN03080606_01685 [Alkaliphilus peptidifermentans DSM 18978]
MITKISEVFDNMFTVSHKKQTRGKTFFAFVIAIIGIFMLPIFFKVEDYNYAKYREQYLIAESVIEEYYTTHEKYPVGGAIQWDREKKLNKFFRESNLTANRRLYYINTDLVPEVKNLKHVFIIDIDQGTLYTRKSVAYRFRRWHFALLE